MVTRVRSLGRGHRGGHGHEGGHERVVTRVGVVTRAEVSGHKGVTAAVRGVMGAFTGAVTDLFGDLGLVLPGTSRSLSRPGKEVT